MVSKDQIICYYDEDIEQETQPMEEEEEFSLDRYYVHYNNESSSIEFDESISQSIEMEPEENLNIKPDASLSNTSETSSSMEEEEVLINQLCPDINSQEETTANISESQTESQTTSKQIPEKYTDNFDLLEKHLKNQNKVTDLNNLMCIAEVSDENFKKNFGHYCAVSKKKLQEDKRYLYANFNNGIPSEVIHLSRKKNYTNCIIDFVRGHPREGSVYQDNIARWKEMGIKGDIYKVALRNCLLLFVLFK